MKRLLLLLLLAASVTAHAQQAANLRQTALTLRAQEFVKVSNDRQAAHYAENRQRCEAALRIAELCGKYAGKFSCDEKGFKPVRADAAIKPIVLDTDSKYKMERCALDAARSSP